MYELFSIEESLTLSMNVVTQLQEFRQAIYKNLCVLRSYATFELIERPNYPWTGGCDACGVF